METTQWIKKTLNTALNNPEIGSIIITVTQPWNYVKEEYDIDIIKQKFDSLKKEFDKEKNIFYEVISSHKNKINFYYPKRAFLNKLLNTTKFKSILLIVGERHSAFVTGRWNNCDGFPMAVAGPLDSWQQCGGGPYSQGSFHYSGNQYLNIT